MFLSISFSSPTISYLLWQWFSCQASQITPSFLHWNGQQPQEKMNLTQLREFSSAMKVALSSPWQKANIGFLFLMGHTGSTAPRFRKIVPFWIEPGSWHFKCQGILPRFWEIVCHPLISLRRLKCRSLVHLAWRLANSLLGVCKPSLLLT